MKNEPRVVLIILTWNQYDDTYECLKSTEKLRYKNFEILVVDNGSTDGSCERLIPEFPDVTFIRNRENRGFAGGMNTGIEAAIERGAEYVLVLNNDTYVSPQIIEPLVRACEDDPGIGIAGPVIMDYYKPVEIDFAGGSVNLLLGEISVQKRMKNESGHYDIEFMTGCCMLIPVKKIEELGMFYADFFNSCEDVDMSLRYRKAGYRIICHPKSILWHKVSAAITTDMYCYFWFRNVLILLSRHLSKAKFWIPFMKIISTNLLKNVIISVATGRFYRLRIFYRAFADFFSKKHNKGSLDFIMKIKKD
jgi:GT2 family glycosyltransferase